MKSFLLRSQMAIDTFLDQHLQRWHLVLLIFIYTFGFIVLSHLGVRVMVPFILISLILINTLADRLRRQGKVAKLSKRRVLTLILVVTSVLIVSAIIASIADPRPFYRPVKGGFELDNGGFIFIVPILLAAIAPYIALVLLLQHLADKKRKAIKGISSKTLFK